MSPRHNNISDRPLTPKQTSTLQDYINHRDIEKIANSEGVSRKSITGRLGRITETLRAPNIEDAIDVAIEKGLVTPP